jgi:hypothetical protein
MTSNNARGKMIYALQMMRCFNKNHKRYNSKITSRVYNNLKEEYSRLLSATYSKKVPWNKGKKQTAEHNKKISNALTGIKRSAESKKKNSDSHKGKVGTFLGRSHSDETKLKLSLFNKEQIECPHCRKTGGRSSMQRWHFNNCRFILKGAHS